MQNGESTLEYSTNNTQTEAKFNKDKQKHMQNKENAEETQASLRHWNEGRATPKIILLKPSSNPS